MSIDKNTKLIKAETYGMLVSRFIKNNTPQIALLTPFVIALASGVGNLIIFLTKKGYCYYFNLNYSFMNFDSTSFLYKIITVSLVSILYWLYSIFSVRMLYIRKNIFKKLVCFIIMPFVFNLLYSFYSTKIVLFNDITYLTTVIISCALCIFIHWPYVYLMGRFMAGTINDDVLEQHKFEKLKKKKLRTYKKENGKKSSDENKRESIKNANNKNNRQYIKDKQIGKIFGALMLLVPILITFGGIFNIGYHFAKMEKQFDTVRIENSNYAVIATDGNQFILELCDISKDKKSVTIDTNTYMKVDCKNLIIHRYKFESVLIK